MSPSERALQESHHHRRHQRTIFHGSKHTPIPVRDYVQRIAEHSKCSHVCFIASYGYLQRLSKVTPPPLVGSRMSGERAGLHPNLPLASSPAQRYSSYACRTCKTGFIVLINTPPPPSFFPEAALCHLGRTVCVLGRSLAGCTLLQGSL